LRGIHGASMSGETAGWSSGPLDPVCAAVSVDAVVDRDGDGDVLGLRGSPASQGAGRWLSVPADPRCVCLLVSGPVWRVIVFQMSGRF
jgi:hypothetical protein